MLVGRVPSFDNVAIFAREGKNEQFFALYQTTKRLASFGFHAFSGVNEAMILQTGFWSTASDHVFPFVVAMGLG